MRDNLLKLSLKEHIQGKSVFTYYKDEALWYIAETGLTFPVPISDITDTKFHGVYKSITLMRWIRKYLEEVNKEVVL